MSSGLVICSKCRRELHQDGIPSQEHGWRHCEDKTPRCAGAHTDYATPDQVKGVACLADDYRMPI
jgi:hypothetical protein